MSSESTMSSSPFAHVPLCKSDGIAQTMVAYKADTSPLKINLVFGVYRDDDGKPWVLPVVKKANDILFNDPTVDYEYLPSFGLPPFTSAAAKLILGDSSIAIAEKRVSSVQTISGTGANHLAALFLSRFYKWPNGTAQIYVPDPSWANHIGVLRHVQVEPVTYPYYDPQTCGLDMTGFLGALETAPSGSVFLLHACAHNPTGVDPSLEQWKQIADVMLKKGHYAYFDAAYQGFASGDLDKDAAAVRHFVSRRIPMLICQSFSKNTGLYNGRVGALHFVCSTQGEVEPVRSQVLLFSRREMSTAPAHGARLVSLILNDPSLFGELKRDITTMRQRILSVREQLRSILTELETPGRWDHITEQLGMFSFTGLTPEQCAQLVEKAHIHLTPDGRISVAGLNSHNIRYFAESLDKVVRGSL